MTMARPCASRAVRSARSPPFYLGRPRQSKLATWPPITTLRNGILAAIAWNTGRLGELRFADNFPGC